MDILLILNRIKIAKSLSTETDLAEFLGITTQRLANWRNRNTLDYPIILTKCEGINFNWLLTGEGEMLKIHSNNEATKEIIFKTKTTENLINLNDEKIDEVIDEKRKLQKTSSIDDADFTAIPIVDIAAAAGCAGELNPDYVDQTAIIHLPNNMVKRGVHNGIMVRGQSMSPTLQDGGYIISRLLDRSEWRDLRDQYVYVLTNKDGETFVKRLKNRLKRHGFVVCMSDNPDKIMYPSFNTLEDDIHNIWAVEWYLTAKMPNIHQTYYSELQTVKDDVEDIKVLLSKHLKPVKKSIK